MPLTFGEAYAKVCPDGRPVAPGSKDAHDIAELMRQSGYKHYTETIVQDSLPRLPKSVEEVQSFIPTRMAPEAPLYVSRRQWMSVEANKQAFIKALNKNNTKP